MAHHAYYIEGSLADFEAYQLALNPFWSKRFDAFGVDDARKLIEFAALKNAAEALFVLGISSITSEAQQALLKLFEEPVPGTTFLLVLPHGVLLPTLRSRMLAYPAERQLGGQNSLASPAALRLDEETRGLFDRQVAAKFLKSDQKSRSSQIAGLLKDDEGAKERAREFVNALEAALAGRVAEPRVREALEDISRVRDYLRDRSPSLKMLLEHLAVSLPVLT